MDVEADRRVTPDRRGAPRPQELSEAERIEAAQFLLGTRQREEAAMRAAHLRGEPSPQDEEHARETLAEMIHLQESITARNAVAPAGRGQNKDADRPEGVDDDTSSSTAPALLVWALMLALLGTVALILAWQLQLL